MKQVNIKCPATQNSEQVEKEFRLQAIQIRIFTSPWFLWTCRGCRISHLASAGSKPLPLSSFLPSASAGCDSGVFCLSDLGVITFRNVFSVQLTVLVLGAAGTKGNIPKSYYVSYELGIFFQSLPHCQMEHCGHPDLLCETESSLCTLLISSALNYQNENK